MDWIKLVRNEYHKLCQQRKSQQYKIFQENSNLVRNVSKAKKSSSVWKIDFKHPLQLSRGKSISIQTMNNPPQNVRAHILPFQRPPPPVTMWVHIPRNITTKDVQKLPYLPYLGEEAIDDGFIDELVELYDDCTGNEKVKDIMEDEIFIKLVQALIPYQNNNDPSSRNEFNDGNERASTDIPEDIIFGSISKCFRDKASVDYLREKYIKLTKNAMQTCTPNIDEPMTVALKRDEALAAYRKFFCRRCYLYSCRLHCNEDENVKPNLKRSNIKWLQPEKPCNENCCLIKRQRYFKFEQAGPCTVVTTNVTKVEKFVVSQPDKFNLYLDAEIRFFKNITKPVRFHVRSTRCSLETDSKCIHNDGINIENACDHLGNEFALWTPMVKSFSPKLTCPIKMGTYAINNGTVDFSIISRLPLEGFRYTVNFKFYEQTKATSTDFLCLDFIFTVTFATNNRSNRKRAKKSRTPLKNKSEKDEATARNSADDWTSSELTLLGAMITVFPENYCAIAAAMPTKTCQQVQKQVQLSDIKPNIKKYKERKVESRKYRWHVFETPFKPCNHEGDCYRNENCACVNCEKFCNCDVTCKKRYTTCSCQSSSSSKKSCNTKHCSCYLSKRECDPDTCKCCTSCSNKVIQQRSVKKLHVRTSEIHGWGVFIDESCPKGEFITEYIGEIITLNEAERRGKVYDKTNWTTIFTLNAEYVIDAKNYGNKVRFINFSHEPNCYAKILRVNCDHRIGIFASRFIEAGEELTLNYNTYNPKK